MEVLKTGDVIGIVSPSHVAVKNDYDIFRKGLENLGLRVKYADNLFIGMSLDSRQVSKTESATSTQ